MNEDNAEHSPSSDSTERAISYTVWPAAPPGHLSPDMERLTREEAIEEYGQTTIEAMETILLLHPAQTVGLQGRESELLVEYAEVQRLPD